MKPADIADARRVINVDLVVDTTPLRGLPLLVAVCAAAALILDGFDIQVIGFAAPAVIAEFGIERAALAPALAAALLGMALGAAAFGAMGDRWGRRPTLLLSTLLFGAATLCTATASSVETLAVWRFVTGVGLGGALPTATTLISEFTPRRFRSQVIALALVALPIGGIIGALLAAEIVPTLGWRSLFIVGGVLPLIAAASMYFVLPESPRFLATRPARSRVLAALLNRMHTRGRYSSDDVFVLSEDTSAMPAGRVRAVFAPELRWDAVTTSLVFLTNVFAIYAFFNWGPLVLTAIGFELAAAARAALVFNVAGVLGSVATAWLISRVGSRWPLASAAAVAVAAVFGLAALASGTTQVQPPGLLSVLIVTAIAGAAISAVQIGMYPVAAHVFPTHCRACGVGCATGSGRVGGIISAFAGGLLLTTTGPAGFFGSLAGVLLLTLAALLFLRRHITRLSA